MTFTIREAEFEDLSFILFLAQKEGWNPGLSDADSFFAADPHGFFIGELEGEKIGCISAINYNHYFGFLGLYIIKPEYRHMGYGHQLWLKAIDYFGDRTIGLDGVVEQQDNYKKSGFKLYYKNIRFEGIGSGSISNDLIDLKTLQLHEVVEYDKPIFGCSRAPFLDPWVNNSTSHSYGLIKDSKLNGYGVIRLCRKGWKIGPLFADDQQSAIKIYEGLITHAEKEPVYLDVPAINSKAIEIANRFKMKKVFETARMYTKQPPDQHLEREFGVTTFELG